MASREARGGHVGLERLHERVEGRLREAERAELERHLASCDTCVRLAREVEELERLARSLQAEALTPRPRQLEPASDASLDAPPLLRGTRAIRRIGRGGAADVWLARDEAGWKALKVVRGEASEAELEALRTYKRTAEDPRVGLLPIHHIARCERSGRLLYTMPLADPLDGQTLEPGEYEPRTAAAWCRRRGGLAPGEVLGIARAVLAALRELHSRGLVHRDVKPANVVSWHGRWYLADTGLLAREHSAGGATRYGTPTYMPPGQRNDARGADLYAMGKSLYELLTGELDGFPTPRRDHLRDDAQRAARRRIYRVAHRACAVDGDARYLRAEQMLADLGGSSASVRRRCLVLALAAASLVGLVAGLAFRESPRAVPGMAGDRPAVGLALHVQLPGGPSWQYRAERALPAGAGILLELESGHPASPPVVLATYIGEERSVHAYESLRSSREGSRHISLYGQGLDQQGAILTLALPQDPAPLLIVHPSGPMNGSGAELEAAVVRALDATGDWPRERGARSAPSLPVRLTGSQARPWRPPTSREGPALGAAAAFSLGDADRLARALSDACGAVDAVLIPISE